MALNRYLNVNSESVDNRTRVESVVVFFCRSIIDQSRLSVLWLCGGKQSVLRATISEPISYLLTVTELFISFDICS